MYLYLIRILCNFPVCNDKASVKPHLLGINTVKRGHSYLSANNPIRFG